MAPDGAALTALDSVAYGDDTEPLPLSEPLGETYSTVPVSDDISYEIGKCAPALADGELQPPNFTACPFDALESVTALAQLVSVPFSASISAVGVAACVPASSHVPRPPNTAMATK